MRIVAWNIRAGGGSRVLGIHDQICRWQPDVVCLCEYRCTPPSLALASMLRETGFEHQLTTADPRRASRNALLLASRRPLRRLYLHGPPREPGRWLAAVVNGGRPFSIGLMHAPNMVTGRKLVYLEAVRAMAARWRRGPALFLGDTNCGWPGIDEETPVFGEVTRAWLDGLEALGWRDGFRYLWKDERFYTWYSPNAGNGFRLDEAFINRSMIKSLGAARYAWGEPQTEGIIRRDALSDHAALLLDFDWDLESQPVATPISRAPTSVDPATGREYP